MPSTSIAAEVTVNTRKADRPDPWAAFKRKSTGPTVIPKPNKVCKEVRPKESPDPHICLVCEVSRERDFNKKRHWIQKHPDQPIDNYSSKIVAKDHELAQKLLQKNEKQDGKSKSKKTTKPSISEKSLEVPVSKVASGQEAKSPSSHLAVQSSLSGFVTPERNLQTDVGILDTS